MLRGALGVLGASALLAIGCAQAFALDPVPTVSVPTVPSVSVPVVTSPVPSVSVPGRNDPGDHDSGIQPCHRRQRLSPRLLRRAFQEARPLRGPRARRQEQAVAPPARRRRGPALRVSGREGSAASRHAPPKFRSRGKNRRGTTLVVWLSSDSTLVFSYRSDRPRLPRGGGIHSCRHTGKEPVQLLRPNRRAPLSAGTYQNPGCGPQGSEGHFGQPRDPGRGRTGTERSDAHAQKSTCGPGEEATKDRAEIAAFVDTQPPGTGGAPVSPSAHGGESGSNGGVVAPEGVDPPANFLLQPRVPKLGLSPDVDGGWSPTALSIAGAMFIALLVIALRELAERHRGREAGWR